MCKGDGEGHSMMWKEQLGDVMSQKRRWERGPMGNAILGSNYIKCEDLLMDVARGSLMVALTRMVFK